nr:hypothetical protein GCM10010200_014510 [Actinomadura rugatobispora]
MPFTRALAVPVAEAAVAAGAVASGLDATSILVLDMASIPSSTGLTCASGSFQAGADATGRGSFAARGGTEVS